MKLEPNFVKILKQSTIHTFGYSTNCYDQDIQAKLNVYIQLHICHVLLAGLVVEQGQKKSILNWSHYSQGEDPGNGPFTICTNESISYL